MRQDPPPVAEIVEPPTGSRLPTWLSESPWWAASALLHAIALVLFAWLIVGTVPPREEEQRTIVRREATPPRVDPIARPDLDKRPRILDELKERPIEKLKIAPVAPKPAGEVDKLTNKPLDDHSIFDEIGLGETGLAGAFGRRGDGAARSQDGASEATERAVLRALHWLRRHQHPDGHWSAQAFTERCAHETCRSLPGGPLGDSGLGMPQHDVGVTALALLAFLGHGNTHQSGENPEFRECVRRAVIWLKRQQALTDPADAVRGVIGPREGESWVYNHAIATMALAELLVVTGDSKLARPVTEATEWILRAQNERFGWRYEYQGGDTDSSVTGWMVLALKNAKLCAVHRLIRLDPRRIDTSLESAVAWFEQVTSAANGITGYRAPGDPGSSLDVYDGPYPFYKERLRCMTAVSVWCRILAGDRRSNAIASGVDTLLENLPEWRLPTGKLKSTINMYHWYYATNALFQYGGPKWRRWNEAMVEVLPASQRIGGDEDGSWDPVGEWGPAGGRVYSTAIGALTLEVYYRYERYERRRK